MINGKEKNKEIKNPPRQTFIINTTKECLQVDKSRINFCKYPIFASSHKQIPVVVELMDYFVESQRKDFHLLNIKISTASKEYGNVMTFKLVEKGDEVTNLEIPIKQREPLTIYVRAAIPELLTSTDINGTLTLQVGQHAPLQIPIVSRGQVPSIICLKEMAEPKTGFKIIKIPSKSKMQIPFKNCSNINFFFELKLLGRDPQNLDYDGVRLRIGTAQPQLQKFQDQKSKKQNPIIKVDANSTFCITLEFQLLKKDGNIRVSRRLLILQVQNTKLFFTFPVEVIIP